MFNKIEQIKWMKFRNQFGQIEVAYRIYEGTSGRKDTIDIGVSFCNPVDFNLPRYIRVLKGKGIAEYRLYRDPVSIDLNSDSVDKVDSDCHKGFRYTVLCFIRNNLPLLGIKGYKGKILRYEPSMNFWVPDDINKHISFGHFYKWFIKFIDAAIHHEKKEYDDFNKCRQEDMDTSL